MGQLDFESIIEEEIIFANNLIRTSIFDVVKLEEINRFIVDEDSLQNMILRKYMKVP